MSKIVIIYDNSLPNLNYKSANDRRVINIRESFLTQKIDCDIFVPTWRSKIENITDAHFQLGILMIGKKYSISILNRIGFYYTCYKQIVKGNYNLVLLYNGIWDSFILIIALKFLKIKVGLEICDKHSENLITKSGVKNILKRFFIIRPTEIFLNRLTNFNIVINNKLLEFVSIQKPNLILPILVDSEYFKFNSDFAKNFRLKNNINEKDIIISFCGSYWYYEGAELLIMAVDKIISENRIRNIKLFFIGNASSNKFKPDLKVLSTKYNLNSIVCFTGKLTEEQLLEAYSASDIFVLPQIKDGFTDYAFPTIIGEYASMGKPIIASNTGEINLFFTENINIIFFENMNIDHLAHQIEILIKDLALRHSLGMNARNLSIEKFGIKANGILLNNFLKKI